MADTAEITEEKSGSDSGMWLSLVAIVMGTFVAILNSSLMSVAMNKFVAVFGSDLNTMQWTITGYTLASAMVIPMCGFLGAKYGNKNVFLYSVAGFTICSVLCGFAWSDSTLIAFRIVQGFAGGFIMPIGMSIIYTTFPREKVSMAIGFWGIAAMVAPALGPTFGGYLIQYYSWKLLFFINVPIGIVAVVLSKILLKNSPRRTDVTFDLKGTILSMIFFGSLLLALTKGQSEGWTSLFIVSLLFVAFFSLLVLIWVETGAANPALDLKILKNAKFSISVVAGSLVMMGMMGATFLTPVYLQSIQGLSAMQTGMLMMPQSIAMAFMMPISGKLADRFGVVPICVAGLSILGIMTLEMHRLTLDTPNEWLNFVLTIRGIGIGLCMMPLTNAGMSSVSKEQVGNASPLSNLFRQVAGSLGIAIFTAVMSNRQIMHYQHIADSVQVDSITANGTLSMLSGAISSWAVDTATATGTAAATLGGLMQKEAMVRSIADTFYISALPAFLCIPFVFLFAFKKKNAVIRQEH